MANKVRNPEYIQNYFAPMKIVLQPPDARTLKYTVDIPLKRPEILQKEILQLASPVNFAKVSGSKSFEIEKDLLKGINSHLNLKQGLRILFTGACDQSQNYKSSIFMNSKKIMKILILSFGIGCWIW